MSIANKMSLSAPSDKAKRQGPSSCHVLAGAWGKTPSGAGKYFPNRHPRKHRFHQMAKSAVATACMLLAFVCQIATAAQREYTKEEKEAYQINMPGLIVKKVSDYIMENEDVQGLDQITGQDLSNIFKGTYSNWHERLWTSTTTIKNTLTDKFKSLFEKRREAANALREAKRIAEAEDAMAEITTKKVMEHIMEMEDAVASAAYELVAKMRQFDVVKTKMNTTGKSLNKRTFHFGIAKDVLPGDMLDDEFPCSPESPIVYYEGGDNKDKKCFIEVSRFDSFRGDFKEYRFPGDVKTYQDLGYKTSICYLVRGTCYKYKEADKTWEENNKRKKKNQDSFVAFWVKDSCEIDISILNKYLDMILPKLGIERRDANVCGGHEL